MTPRKYIVISFVLLYASLIPFLLRLTDHPQGDVQLYFETIRNTFAGDLPYLDKTFEYPPYALIWFLVPFLGGSLHWFQMLFAAQILLIDIFFKYYLIDQGWDRHRDRRAFEPFLLYAVGVGFLNHFYLQRMDLIPAVLTVGTLVAFSRRKPFLAGVLLALGTGTKLYPILFGLPLTVLAWRRGQGKRFFSGGLCGILPILLMSLWIPWWRFLAFHSERGLEVESLYASVLWLGHLLFGLEADWAWVKAWQELGGPIAQNLVSPARLLCLAVTGMTILLVSGRIAACDQEKYTLSQMARMLLIILLPFVAFNIVLSPQYIIWLLTLGALASLEGRSWLLWLLSGAAVLTPIWYPSPEFSDGFNLFQTCVLLTRNLMLIGIWIGLVIPWIKPFVSRHGFEDLK